MDSARENVRHFSMMINDLLLLNMRNFVSSIKKIFKKYTATPEKFVNYTQIRLIIYVSNIYNYLAICVIFVRTVNPSVIFKNYIIILKIILIKHN